jgi:hypothetical protein
MHHRIFTDVEERASADHADNNYWLPARLFIDATFLEIGSAAFLDKHRIYGTAHNIPVFRWFHFRFQVRESPLDCFVLGVTKARGRGMCRTHLAGLGAMNK